MMLPEKEIRRTGLPAWHMPGSARCISVRRGVAAREPVLTRYDAWKPDSVRSTSMNRGRTTGAVSGRVSSLRTFWMMKHDFLS